MCKAIWTTRLWPMPIKVIQLNMQCRHQLILNLCEWFFDCSGCRILDANIYAPHTNKDYD